MDKFIIKPASKGKVNIAKQVSVKLYGVSWRLGTSRTVPDKKEYIDDAKNYIDKYIETRSGWSLSQLVDTYPKQYKKALDRTSGEKAVLTYRQAVKELIPYLRTKVDSNTLYSRINSLRHFGDLFNLNGLDVTSISAEEINRILIKKHEMLGSKSLATFDTSLASFRHLFNFLDKKGYTETNLLIDYRIERPDIVRVNSRERKHYKENELDYIYECLDDNRHLITDPEYFVKLRHDIRKGSLVDPQYYKAHYKVRRILQVVMETGLRQGEVIMLRKAALNGAITLNYEIDFTSELWKELEKSYNKMIYDEPYSSILESGKLDELHVGNIHEMYPEARRFTYADKVRFMNTLKFLDKFLDDDLVYWKDFGWSNPMYGDHHVSRRNKGSVGLSKIVSYDTDIFWLKDAIPDHVAELIVVDTITKDVDAEGKVYIRSKGGAKTDSGTGRRVPLSKRARITFVKVWRDILALEQPDPEKIDYLFLNPVSKFYDPSAVSNAWTKLNRKMVKYKPDLPTLSPHKLRHSYITIKAKSAVTMGDLVKLRDEVGHMRLSTTMDVYVGRDKAHLDPNKSDL